MAAERDLDSMAGPSDGQIEIEEGEFVSAAGSGSDTDTDDEDARYYLQPRHDDRRLPGSPASSLGLDGTVSEAAVARARGFSCHVCLREFPSWKAVHGHMRVHAQTPPKLQVAAAVFSGAASAVEEVVGDSASASTAIVVAAETSKVSDDMTTTPVQSTGSNSPALNGGSVSPSARSSVEPSQSAAAAPPEQAPVAPTPAPAPPQQHAAAPQRATYIPLMVPASSQQAPVGAHHPRQPAPGGSGFTCKECDRWFLTHQGLGGHVAGHKNRRLAAEAAAAVAAGIDLQAHLACRGGGRPEKSHACKICGAEYPSGVSLGGHMRKHYVGKPIVPRKRMRLGPPELLALAPPLQQRAPLALEAPIAAPLSVEAPIAAPPPVQVPAGCLRLFGVTIVQQAKEEDKEEPPVEMEVDKEEGHPVDGSATGTEINSVRQEYFD